MTGALVLSPEPPYPAVGGGPLRIASLLEFLSPRFPTDLILFHEDGSPDPREALPPGLVRETCLIRLPRHNRRFPARASRNALRLLRNVPPLTDRFAGFDAHLRRFLEGRSYRLGVIEHFWCAPYVSALREACRFLALDLHNIESEWHAACSRTMGPLVSTAHRRFSQACLRLEREWLPRFDVVVTCSAEDARRVQSIAPESTTRVFRNAIPLVLQPGPAKSETIVFSGNLAYEPNRDALAWFRIAVWPRLRDRHPRLRWRIIGKGAEAARKFAAGDGRIELTGPVDDALREIASAAVAVVPIRSGSGTRIKILEAWAAGTPVVSTSFGAEGLAGLDREHLLLADGEEAFSGAVSRLLDDPALAAQLARNARLLYERHYTWDAAWKELNEWWKTFPLLNHLY